MEYNLSREFSEKYFSNFLKEWNLKLDQEFFNEGSQFVFEENPPLMYGEILKLISRYGYIKEIEEYFNLKRDPILSGQLSLATNFPNAKLTVSHYENKFEVQCPGRIAPIEEDLATDLLESIFEFAQLKLDMDETFEIHSRKFRTIMTLSINLIECFIYKHLKIYAAKKYQIEKIKEIRECRIFKHKVQKFYNFHENNNLKDLVKRQEYHRCMEINGMRNSIIHSNYLYAAYSLEEMVKYINKIPKGVGGLLKLFRTAHKQPCPFFVSRINNLPNISK